MSLPKISEAEWEVMKILWENSPLTANEVIESLAHHTDWKPKTIRTLLNRLVTKEALSIDYSQKVYAYYPLVSENECKRGEIKSFMKRIYGGAMKPIFVNFLKEEKLSKKDIEELKSILNEKSQNLTK